MTRRLVVAVLLGLAFGVGLVLGPLLALEAVTW